MKKLSILITSLVLFAGISFANNPIQQKADKKEAPKKEEKKEVKKVPAKKKTDKKDEKAPATK